MRRVEWSGGCQCDDARRISTVPDTQRSLPVHDAAQCDDDGMESRVTDLQEALHATLEISTTPETPSQDDACPGGAQITGNSGNSINTSSTSATATSANSSSSPATSTNSAPAATSSISSGELCPSCGRRRWPCRVLLQDGGAVLAEHVVFSASLGVLKQAGSMFEPPLPPDKLMAVEVMVHGNLLTSNSSATS